MKRVILTPATLPPTALAELKQWLGITTASDDAPLRTLLAAAMDTCEAFTGVLPIEAVCEEIMPASLCWRALATGPIQAIAAVEAVAGDGTRTALASGAWEIDLDGDGGGHVRIAAPMANRIVVRFTAGLASDWDSLPTNMRHGIVRLAAHQHRERESDGASPLPPASVAALWRPWRRMRLA
ncbi:head-tail connector protein [Novosphingobium sp. Leaf2]|uniref:head-tail connector protein n=1 Tax=Novosphingobium sp. Leaf2 TaxID=1735670 RepID=UPI0006F244FD|nr:hypothetical protein [Novosphingobium sp. Leaf2]KQM20248.1 hypothetical protein ASE49_17175 [Novosphingobium sp. Leaf2]